MSLFLLLLGFLFGTTNDSHQSGAVIYNHVKVISAATLVQAPSGPIKPKKGYLR
jgi:hypothetical protein